jgi:ubiquinone/menaquinone biosynthesis C-methylase UbiE
VIDVAELIARYSPAEHAARADAYFERLESTDHLRRKPFASIEEAPLLARALSVLIPHLHLFPGARVLDFGAGTCWSSIILGYLGCDVVALDVSAAALAIGASIKADDPIARNLPIAFERWDGAALGLPDESIDRIVCIDAFHHVADQRATLAEMFRVMKPGAVAAFHEVGPRHSRGVLSQFEMANFGVIENDIDVRAIERTAKRIGFRSMRAAYFQTGAMLVRVGRFERWLAGWWWPWEVVRFLYTIARELDNRRVFFLIKGAPPRRRRRAFIGRLRVDATISGDRIAVRFDAKNLGRAVWNASGSSDIVNLGVHLRSDAGETIALDYARIAVSQGAVPPGSSVSGAGEIALPGLTSFELVFDLVCEGKLWFESAGGRPVSIRFSKPNA